MKLVKIIICLIVMLIALANFQTSFAASPVCDRYHVVAPYDTIRKISTFYEVTPWSLIKANLRTAERPSHPIFLGQRLCIPYKPGTERIASKHVLNANPAETLITKNGTKLQIVFIGYNPGSIWKIKVNNINLGTVKITTKNPIIKNYTIKTSYNKICLKNMKTDGILCFGVNK